MTTLIQLLTHFRNAAHTEREKGTYFERLTLDFLIADAVFAPQFTEVLSFADWAEKYGKNGKDTGIDLVAKNANDGTFCAIQCKFYADDYAMQKGDIDSFFTAAGKREFTRCLIVDSTRAAWSANAEDALSGQSKPTSRVGLYEMENSSIDWSAYLTQKQVKTKAKKTLRPHQADALAGVKAGLAQAARGKLIMACGTGKTFTSLKIAEDLAGAGKRVLFLVPSLALMSQTISEWSIETTTPLHAFAVCSDAQVGQRKSGDDLADTAVHDLAYPAMTDAKKLAEQDALTATAAKDKMTVVFSTYHSIQVVSSAQQKHGLPEFDLIICDEAHRTTGAALAGDESAFLQIHDASFIKGKKRVYMTATPRIFGDLVKTKAKEVSVELASMDDASKFGELLYELSFSEAVRLELLCRYKVIVLAVSETEVSATLQARQADGNAAGLILDDVTKMIGCYRGLSLVDAKQKAEDLAAGKAIRPMKRAVAFCNTIKNSKKIQSDFVKVVNDYRARPEVAAAFADFACEASHVDGSYNATARNAELAWLKADTEGANGGDICRILSNARCLTEGVDVPALDAIMFLHPRKSQIDVVQAVGRVMRRAEGKERGYVILPIAVPANKTAEEVLADNDSYKVVIQVLSALRAHDDEFEATLNKLDLGADITDHIQIIDATSAPSSTAAKQPNEQIIDPIDHLPTRASAAADGLGEKGKAEKSSDDDSRTSSPAGGGQTVFGFDEYQRGIYALLVKKLVKKDNWAYWAADIARIALTHISRITGILQTEGNTAEQVAFAQFLKELRGDLNDSITEVEAIEMLAQHIITKPVFDTLFEGYSFTQNNPVSVAMQHMLNVLDKHQLDSEAESLHRFYASVKMRVSGITDIKVKQRIIVELYDEFFRNAFPKMTERLGIVYTPVEVVDFIIHSINDVLQSEFGQTLGSKGVHIIDPFTGTGTFITRLLQSGLIKPEELAHKYKHEIHANEIVLLAYYIAAINIEQVYHDIVQKQHRLASLSDAGKAVPAPSYVPFEGICLADTFALYEKEDLATPAMSDNSGRRKKQKALDIRVIMGNPPYSAGQTSANDNNANIEYKTLDESIRRSYALHSNATNKNALYDSYIRAIRWASDRVGNSGVIGFVTNAGFLDANTADGLRYCLAKEFSNIYVFHLRGNARTSGEERRKEKDNVFGQGTRTPIAVSILVKNPAATEFGQIYWHDIGDYLSREDKLSKVTAFKSLAGITTANGWQPINPDKHHDWVGQRDDGFAKFLSLGDKKDASAVTVFENYSMGIKTNRDAWVYSFSNSNLQANIKRMVDFYNEEAQRFADARVSPTIDSASVVENFINLDDTKISWSRALRSDISKNVKHAFKESVITTGLYRPFTKQNLYYDRSFINDIGQTRKFFPTADVKNRVICATGVGSNKDFSVLMSAQIPELHTVSTGQCFPEYVFDAEIAAASRSEPQRAAASRSEPQRAAASRSEPQRAAASRSAIIPTRVPITAQNLVICVTGRGSTKDFCALMTDTLPDLEMISKGQCFPMFLFETEESPA
jgi:predicted helicase